MDSYKTKMTNSTGQEKKGKRSLRTLGQLGIILAEVSDDCGRCRTESPVWANDVVSMASQFKSRQQQKSYRCKFFVPEEG